MRTNMFNAYGRMKQLFGRYWPVEEAAMAHTKPAMELPYGLLSKRLGEYRLLAKDASEGKCIGTRAAQPSRCCVS